MNLYKVRKRAYLFFVNRFFKNKVALALVGVFVRSGLLRGRGRYSNFIVSNYDYQKRNQTARSLPTNAALNVTNLCNYHCKFCEIHYFYKFAREKSGRVWANNLSLDDVEKYHGWLRGLVSLELSGATGEPFANPDFTRIVARLKDRYPGLILSATTNGSLIRAEHIDSLIDSNFDRLLFSIHGGDPDVYKILQGGNFDRIIATIEKITKRKAERHSTYPFISINFALNKINAQSIFNLIDKVAHLGVDAIMVQHYYDTRNDMKSAYDLKDVSYYYNVEDGNAMLDKIYGYAAQKGVRLHPKRPLYLDVDKADKTSDEADYGAGDTCRSPWAHFKMKGCVEEKDSVYLSVCNRGLLFKLKPQEFYAKGGTFNDVWNHELAQYMRKTVGQNPLCKFCLSPNTKEMRCLDNVKYSQMRDTAVKELFAAFRRDNPNVKEVPGLEVLDKNPYEFTNG